MNIQIEYIDISLLKPNEYNPKSLGKKAAADLEESIRKFGVVDPFIVNSAEERKNIIIGGHQRYNVCKKMGVAKVPVVYLNIADRTKERELCLRLSKNVGEWDWDLLANFDEELLKMTGFSDAELKVTFNLDYDDLL